MCKDLVMLIASEPVHTHSQNTLHLMRCDINLYSTLHVIIMGSIHSETASPYAIINFEWVYMSWLVLLVNTVDVDNVRALSR